MLDEYDSVPFTDDEIYGGFAQCVGNLSASGNCLVIEFQTKDAVVGAIKSQVKSIEIPFNQLRSFQVIKKWYSSAKIRIETKSLAGTQNYPSQTPGTLLLKINKNHADIARQICSKVNLAIAEMKLDALG